MTGLPIFAVQVIDDIVAFFRRFANGMFSGLFAFGSVWDIIRTVIDLSICSVVFYFVLVLVRDTRAWQLLKGLIFVVGISLFSDLLGLQTMKYILSSTLSILAIALLVIFQPELRRALEKVGRKTGGLLNVSAWEHRIDDLEMDDVSEAISKACQRMAIAHCGALIIIERRTPIAELAEQSNAVKVDAAVTAMNLEQIFYEGSPMHDGAVLIRNGRIYAARCHVPLSDDTLVKDGLGTRHRAAIGASELSDAVGVVVSEERGTISLTLEGRLYRISDEGSLQGILKRLLKPRESKQKPRPNLRRFWGGSPAELSDFQDEADHSFDDTAESHEPARRHNRNMKLISMLLSLFLWIYIQSTANPTSTVTVKVPIQMHHLELLEANQLDFIKSDNVVELEIQTRRQYEDRMNTGNIVARLDFADLNLTAVQAKLADGKASVQEKMTIHVSVKNLFPMAYQISRRNPSTFFVSIIPAAESNPSAETSNQDPGKPTVVMVTESGGSYAEDRSDAAVAEAASVAETMTAPAGSGRRGNDQNDDQNAAPTASETTATAIMPVNP